MDKVTTADLVFAVTAGTLANFMLCLAWGAALNATLFNFGFGVTQAEEIADTVLVSFTFSFFVAVITWQIDEVMTDYFNQNAK